MLGNSIMHRFFAHHQVLRTRTSPLLNGEAIGKTVYSGMAQWRLYQAGVLWNGLHLDFSEPSSVEISLVAVQFSTWILWLFLTHTHTLRDTLTYTYICAHTHAHIYTH